MASRSTSYQQSSIRERDDLFHLPMDDAVRLLHRIAGRRGRIRADDSLYECTVFAYRDEAEARLPRITRERPVNSVHAREKRDKSVPVLRPLLPTADRLVPYLRRIDATRIYTNFGPLACELERRAIIEAMAAGLPICAASVAEPHALLG